MFTTSIAANLWMPKTTLNLRVNGVKSPYF